MLAAWLSKDLTVPQMQHMAEIVSEHYRKRGYMVASAYVGAQTIADNTLTITVVEGRFGDIQMRSNTSVVSDARILRTFSENLCGRADGCEGLGPIRAGQLERAGLLVAEVPGVKATYELAPGEAPGTTSLQIDAAGGRRISGQVGADNSGLAAIGRQRVSPAISLANLLGLGDVLTLSGAYSGNGYWTFALDASAPVGYGGTRAGLTAAQTRYVLGREFADLGATGASDTAGLYMSHPLRRRANGSADLRLDVVGKRMSTDFKQLDFKGRLRAAEAMLSLSARQADTLFRAGSTNLQFTVRRQMF